MTTILARVTARPASVSRRARPLGPARLAILVAISLIVGLQGQTQELVVAAAADLQGVLPQLARRFEGRSGAHLTLTFGSSGNFFSQIRNGAPFDLFLSADADYPRQLEMLGLVEPGTLFGYAVGRIVLWTRKDSGLDVRKGLGILTDSRVRHVALANPDHAPYGRAAVAALQHQGLYEAVRPKFVVGESVSQAAQFAQSGNAEAGLIALSLARTPALQAAGSYLEIPDSWHPALAQTTVILAGARNKGLARQFLAFLREPESGAALRQAGFLVPEH